MKYLLIFAGMIFLLKGVAKSFAVAHGPSASGVTSAYAAGLITGQSIVALAFVVGGVALVKLGWSAAMSRPPAA